MRDMVLKEMDALGCAPALRRLVADLPDAQSVVVRPHRAAWLPIAASQDREAALYMNRTHVHVKLDPADGGGVRGAKRVPRARRERADRLREGYGPQAGDPGLQEELRAAVARALAREITASDPAATTEDFCLETGLALPVTGWCDDCEQYCG